MPPTADSSNQTTPDAPGDALPYVVGGEGQRYDIEHIMRLIPHRPPFLLVDCIKSIETHAVVAIKNVSINEPYFQGHFPGHPVMPGVLLIEALAQAGCIMLNNRQNRQRTYYLAGVDSARFKRRVVPGDVLELRVRSIQERRKLGKAQGEVWVGENMVAEATILFAESEV